MEIIVPGDKSSLKKTFYCNTCGCIFNAYWHEYMTSNAAGDTYFCTCPTCDCHADEINKDNFSSAVSVLLAEKLKDFEKRG